MHQVRRGGSSVRSAADVRALSRQGLYQGDEMPEEEEDTGARFEPQLARARAPLNPAHRPHL